jgi:exosome complex RNA-binding protein Csl4
MGQEITEADLGKPVVFEGDTIGRVVEYTDSTAYVDRDTEIGETIQGKLGWDDTDELWPLQRELVEETTDEEIRLVAPM